MDDNAEARPQTKAELRARVERAREALDALINPLSADQLAAPGPDGGWSVRDHLVHLFAWEAGMAALLQRQPRWEAMRLDRELVMSSSEEKLNELIQERHRDLSPDDVLLLLRATQRAFDTALDGISEEELHASYASFEPQETEAPRERPVLDYLMGNTYEHYEEHMGYLQELLGRG